jgi:hypothetical protein
MYICENWYVFYVLFDNWRARIQSTKTTTRTIFHIYTLLPPDVGPLASPKHAEV